MAEHLRPRFATEQPGGAEGNQRVGSESSPSGSTEQATAQATAQAGVGQTKLVQQLVQLTAIQWQIVGSRASKELVGLRRFLVLRGPIKSSVLEDDE